MNIAGMMSGTSLDGLTIAEISMPNLPSRINPERLKELVRKARFLTAKTYDFPSSLKGELATLVEPRNAISTKLIADTSVNLGWFAAERLKEFVRRESHRNIDLVAFHGQTIYHEPGSKGKIGSTKTLQIGDPSPLCYELKVPVVSDVRSMDVAAGGQGAPIVPIVDYLRYSGEGNKLVLNVGGIANMTFLPKNDDMSKVRAFDVGPGNMLIDGAMSLISGSKQSYDNDGRLATRGKVSQGLFDWILRNDNFRFVLPPKTTGREKYDRSFLERLMSEGKKLHLSDEDLIASISSYTVFMIHYHIKQLKKKEGGINEMIMGGGGTKNKFIMGRLKELLPDTKISLHDSYGVPSWTWEGFAFAVIGYLTYHRITGNVVSATGATSPVVLGRMNYPPRISLS